jgi:7,8-dihydropterin-6-yl-methyl-4-(beta-D-ribofuranosyl)aminobenzene 5'-phosphate synthase
MKDLIIVDNLTITVLVDNVIEWSGSEKHKNVLVADQWVKEKERRSIYVRGGHGLAFLIQTNVGDQSFEILYDTGPSGEVLLHNLKTLGLDVSSVDAIVMSHGHWDHFGGLLDVLKRIGRNDIPVYIHPKMLNARRTVAQTDEGKKINDFPQVPTAEEIVASGGKLVISADPLLLAGDTILRTGEISRLTEFENGFPNHQMLVDGDWVDDSKVIDDNCLGIRTPSGIVVVTGCAHSGIINSVKEVMKLTGEDNIRAIIGGFHLMGKRNMSRVEKTVMNLKELNPSLIVPCHCTGAPAQHLIAQEVPEAYATGSTGNRYVF